MTTTSAGLLDESALLDACDKLVDLHAWDPTKVDPRAWLDNFDRSERNHAVLLLNRFTFLDDHLVDQLFRAAFHNISNGLSSSWETFAAAQQRWRRFCDEAVVTIIQGEQPNPSDSGWYFARKARQILGIAEERLLEPHAALDLVAQGFNGPVVFVDDFVGSGDQFLSTWRRQYQLSIGGTASFESRLVGAKANFYYCNAMTTE